MPTVTFESATDDQLKAFAAEKGLSIHPMTGRDKIIAKIKAVHEGNEFDVAEAKAETPKPAEKVDAIGNGFVIVKIHTSEAPGGDQDVPLGFNGKFTVAPRGRWIGLRPGYFGALQDAVEDKFERIKGDDGLTKINPVPRKVHRFPHEVWRSSTPPEEGVLYPPEVNRDVREKARVA